MKTFAVLSMLLLSSACGKMIHVTALQVIPAHSTTAQVYTGDCPSTYNEVYYYDEVRWSDGSVGCETAHQFKVGDSSDFQASK